MNETGEIVDPMERAKMALEFYRRTDSHVGPGALAFEEYDRWHKACAEVPLAPGLALEAAWLQAERSLAMPYAIDPDTNKTFLARQVDAARKQTRTAFEEIMSMPDAPLGTRLLAELSRDSISIYANEVRAFPKYTPPELRLPHLEANHEVTRQAIAELGNLDPELGDIITLFSIINEYGATCSILALPAAPRQKWDINVYHSLDVHTIWTGLSVGSVPQEDHLVLSPEVLGHGQWAKLPETIWNVDPGVPIEWSMPAGRLATLQASAAVVPGMVPHLINVDSMPEDVLRQLVSMTVMLRGIGKDIISKFDSVRWFKVPPRAKATPAPKKPKEPKSNNVVIEEVEEEFLAPVPLPNRPLRPEATWYLTRHGGDLADHDKRMLAMNIRNLQNAEQQEDGLLPMERYALGWMRMEQANDFIAADDPETAAQWFTWAAHSFLKSAEDFLRPPRRPGMACEALLAFESTIIYRDVYTNPNRAEMLEQIDDYKKRLAVLSEKLHEHQNEITDDEEELDILIACAARITLALIVMDATDPRMRDLVLPTHVRGSNYRANLAAYRLQETPEGTDYDITAPIAVHIINGTEIRPSTGGLIVGRDLLAPPDNPLALLNELARIIRPPQPTAEVPSGQKKQTYKKRKAPKVATPPVRSEAVNELTATINNGIAAAHKSLRFTRMTGKQRKKELYQ